MSKGPSSRQVEAQFQNFIEEDEQCDIGITIFDGRLEALETDANENGGADSALINPGLDELNQAWLYHDEIATITGRIYLTDNSLAEDLKEAWGGPDIDEEGNASYFVENVELRSYGITEGMHGRDLGNDRSAARIGYGFALPMGEEMFAQFMLYPGEASRHQYVIPTPEAIDVRLHRLWPEEMTLIDKLIKSRDREIAKLPRRLALIARRLQQSFINSADFREWASIYINERIKFDQVWPYMVQVKDELLCQDDEAIDPDDIHWLEVACDSPVTLHGRRPRIEFVRESFNPEESTAMHAMLFLELPDTENEWAGTQVGVRMENLLRIRGTRVYRSIIDRALGTAERNFHEALSQQPEWERPDVGDVSFKKVERPHHGGDPLFVEEMKLLDSEFKSIIKLIAPITKRKYDTFEQAGVASQGLTTVVADRLLGAGIGNYMLEFDGEYCVRPRIMRETDDEVQEGQFILRVDPENPFIQLQHGDSFQGTYHGFYSDVKASIDGGQEYYQPLPYLIVDIGSDNTTLLTSKGIVPVVEVEVRRRALIPLDGTARITLPALERYMADRAAQVKVADTYGKDPIVHGINTLFQALHRETNTGYQELRHVEQLRAIAERIEQKDLKNGVHAALAALEAMFWRRSVMVSGDIYTDEGVYEESGFSEGFVIDVRLEYDKADYPGPYLVVLDKNYGENRFIRVSTIKTFAF